MNAVAQLYRMLTADQAALQAQGAQGGAQNPSKSLSGDITPFRQLLFQSLTQESLAGAAIANPEEGLNAGEDGTEGDFTELLQGMSGLQLSQDMIAESLSGSPGENMAIGFGSGAVGAIRGMETADPADAATGNLTGISDEGLTGRSAPGLTGEPAAGMKASAQNLTGAAAEILAGAPVEGQTTVQAESLENAQSPSLAEVSGQDPTEGQIKAGTEISDKNSKAGISGANSAPERPGQAAGDAGNPVTKAAADSAGISRGNAGPSSAVKGPEQTQGSDGSTQTPGQAQTSAKQQQMQGLATEAGLDGETGLSEQKGHKGLSEVHEIQNLTAAEVANTEGSKPLNPASAAAEKMEPYSQIGREIQLKLEQRGLMEFKMQLEPKDLGQIDVRLRINEGKLIIDIVAASSRTQALLISQADKLVSSMGLQNVEVETVQVNLQSDQQSDYGQQGHLHQQDHLEQQARNRNNAPQPLNQPLGDDAVNNPEGQTRDMMRKNYFVRMDYIV
ncbi:MAG: flagellar hook-length control protein FliK [Bacillota bacterium]|nr:flagellar hook-length control protein FliK [Bacillota bacterium]